MPRGPRKRKSTCAAEPSRRPSPLLQYLQAHSHKPAGSRSSPSSARRSSHDPTIESEDIKETLADATSLPSSGPRFIPVGALVAITVVQLLTSAPCGQHAVSSEPNERALHDRGRFVLQPPCHPPNEREVRFRAERRRSSTQSTPLRSSVTISRPHPQRIRELKPLQPRPRTYCCHGRYRAGEDSVRPTLISTHGTRFRAGRSSED
jgi:hypothetical protein